MAMPLNESQAKRAVKWMKSNFGPQLEAAVDGTPFSVDLLCGIACQESAIYWLGFLQKQLTPDQVLARCVFDASGDDPKAPRKPFPKNTAEFRAKYGDEFTDMLIAEANEMRKLRDLKPKQWVYKGYGIFQYDLQAVERDEDFFRKKQWYAIGSCLDRAIGELKEKYKASGGDLWKAVKAYNGTGPKATAYANNVKQFTAWAAEVPGQ